MDLKNCSALVVEDDATGLAVIAVMLRQLGIQTTMERYANAVLDRVRKMYKIDVIFLDIGLPDGDGYEILQQLKREPKLKDVPIIAVTARDATTEMPKAQAAGFDGFLGKPLNRGRFPNQVRRILTGKAVWETYH